MEYPEPVRLREHRIRRSDIDTDARRVLRRLYDFGFHAYLVGGSVRDLMLDRTPKDFDVATSARPNEVRRLFRRCRLIGRRFRLAHVLGESGKIIETATFRAKPPAEEATLITDDNQFGTPASDAHRRDFTINALFYDMARNEVIDYVGGLDDLDARVLRTIGEPVTRFREDPIRMLRAVKFAARLDFDLDTELHDAILAERAELKKASVPRLYEEMRRLLWSGAAARCFELLDELRLLELLVPELSGFLGRPSDDPWHPLRGLLEALDARFASEADAPPDGLLFVPLFWPVYEALLAELPGPLDAGDERRLAESLLGPMAIRLGMPRRAQETLLRVVEGQRRFRRGHGRRGGRNALPRDPDYSAIVAFAEMRGDAGDLAEPIAEAWSDLTDEHAPPPLEDHAPRRRRNRRNRRG
ncbi:MAG: polynucleotide adenylyltransferase PcnB [bacterium]